MRVHLGENGLTSGSQRLREYFSPLVANLWTAKRDILAAMAISENGCDRNIQSLRSALSTFLPDSHTLDAMCGT